MIFRFLIKAWWTIVPHPFVSQSQFSSGICRRCGSQHLRKWF